MNAYRIYTEDRGPDAIEQIFEELAHWKIDGATLIHTHGIWKGVVEDSLIIEVFTDKSRNYMESVAERIREVNGNQEAVALIATIPADVQFISKRG